MFLPIALYTTCSCRNPDLATDVVAPVTGCAGFIGSHLCEALISGGDQVVGLDAFTKTYASAAKWTNLGTLRTDSDFSLQCVDLAELPRAELTEKVAEVDVVFHLAAEPGVRASWGAGFDAYIRNNIAATQRLLEAIRAGNPSGTHHRCVVIVHLWRCGSPPDVGECDPKASLPLRRDETGHRAVVSGLPHKLRAPHRRTAILFGLRSTPATRHGFSQVYRPNHGRAAYQPFRRRKSTPRFHFRS